MAAPALLLYAATQTKTGRRTLGCLVTAAALALLMLVAVIGAAVSIDSAGVGAAVVRGCVAGLRDPATASEPGAAWSAEQLGNAATIVQVGQQMDTSPRAWLIALATAMQESTLRNLPGGDRDSLGLFQQRPSQGWGSPEQILDPAYAARAFYTHLLEVPGWETQPLTVAAQTVQHSAFPSAYGKWEQPAANLLAELGADLASLVCSAATIATGAVGLVLARAADQLGKPYQWGATGPRAFDCSGLTMYAWQAAGVQLPRVSRDQARAGQQVPLDQAQPGDLLFWSTDRTLDGVHHVALYLGDGRIREAPTTGIPVRDRALGGTYDEAELLPFAIRPASPAT